MTAITIPRHPVRFSYGSWVVAKEKGKKSEARRSWSWDLGYGIGRRQVSYRGCI